MALAMVIVFRSLECVDAVVGVDVKAELNTEPGRAVHTAGTESGIAVEKLGTALDSVTTKPGMETVNFSVVVIDEVKVTAAMVNKEEELIVTP